LIVIVSNRKELKSRLEMGMELSDENDKVTFKDPKIEGGKQ
jgi:hypothetical protein